MFTQKVLFLTMILIVSNNIYGATLREFIAEECNQLKKERSQLVPAAWSLRERTPDEDERLLHVLAQIDFFEALDNCLLHRQPKDLSDRDALEKCYGTIHRFHTILLEEGKNTMTALLQQLDQQQEETTES